MLAQNALTPCDTCTSDCCAACKLTFTGSACYVCQIFPMIKSGILTLLSMHGHLHVRFGWELQADEHKLQSQAVMAMLTNLTTISYSSTEQHQSCVQSTLYTAATNAARNTMMRAICCIIHCNRAPSKLALPFPMLVLRVDPAGESPWRLH